MGGNATSVSGSEVQSSLWWGLGALGALSNTQSKQESDMARETLWLVKCTDRDGDDVDGLRE